MRECVRSFVRTYLLSFVVYMHLIISLVAEATMVQSHTSYLRMVWSMAPGIDGGDGDGGMSADVYILYHLKDNSTQFNHRPVLLWFLDRFLVFA